jgi:hypothetical protein
MTCPVCGEVFDRRKLEQALMHMHDGPEVEMADRYEVVPMKRGPHHPEGWWTVTRNGEHVRHYPPDKRDLAERYATDPEYRAILVTKMLHER